MNSRSATTGPTPRSRASPEPRPASTSPPSPSTSRGASPTTASSDRVLLRAPRSPEAWSGRTRPPTAVALPTSPIRSPSSTRSRSNRGCASPEGGRRGPAHSHEDRSTRRHHLHLLEPQWLPRQHRPAGSVPGRRERTLALQQRRDRRAERRTEFFIGYLQDEWKVKPKFTLNYGVRVDKYKPLREANDLGIMFDTVEGGAAPQGHRLLQVQRRDPAARGLHLCPRGVAAIPSSAAAPA